MGLGGAGCSWNVLCRGSVFAGRDSGPRLWPGIIRSQPPRHLGFRLRGNHGASSQPTYKPFYSLARSLADIYPHHDGAAYISKPRVVPFVTSCSCRGWSPLLRRCLRANFEDAHEAKTWTKWFSMLRSELMATPSQGRQSWGLRVGRDPQILGRGSQNIIIAYYVQEVCSKM